VPEKDLLFNLDKNALVVVGVVVLGCVAKALGSSEPINWPKFFGEVILSMLGALALISFGLLSGYDWLEIFFFGCCSSVGSMRVLTWAIRIMLAVRGKQND